MNCPKCKGYGFIMESRLCPECHPGQVPNDYVALKEKVEELKKLLSQVLPPNCWECEWKTCPIEEKYQWCRPDDCPAAKAVEVE